MNPDDIRKALEELRRILSGIGDMVQSVLKCEGCPAEPIVAVFDLQPAIGGSNLPAAGTGDPLVELARTPFTERVAYRIVRVRFSPALCFEETAVTWEFLPDGALRGSMPAAPNTHVETFEAVPGFVKEQIDANGETAIRVNLPSVGFNKGTVTVTSVKCPDVSSSFRVEVPAVVVIDPGHGGTDGAGSASDFNYSNANDATSWWAWYGALPAPQEQTLTLDLSRRIQAQLTGAASAQGLSIHVYLTRTSNVNLDLTARANVARDNGADVFVSIHFNSYSQPAHGSTSRIGQVSNANSDQDANLARRVTAGTVGALAPFYSSSVHATDGTAQALGVLSDAWLGNSASTTPAAVVNPNMTRACLHEVEFINHNEAFSRLWNLGEVPSTAQVQGTVASPANAPSDTAAPTIYQQNVDLVRNAAAAGIAGGILDDLLHVP